jgi:hypothetical protein
MLMDFVMDAIGNLGGKTQTQLRFMLKTQDFAIQEALETLKAMDLIYEREVKGIMYYYQSADGKKSVEDTEKGSGSFGKPELKPNLVRFRQSKQALVNAGRGVSEQHSEGLSVSDLEHLIDDDPHKSVLRRK